MLKQALWVILMHAQVEKYQPTVTFQLSNIMETWTADEYWPQNSRYLNYLGKGTYVNKPQWPVIECHKFYSIMFFHKVPFNIVESNLQRCFKYYFK